VKLIHENYKKKAIVGDQEINQSVTAEPQVQTKKVFQCFCVRVKKEPKYIQLSKPIWCTHKCLCVCMCVFILRYLQVGERGQIFESSIWDHSNIITMKRPAERIEKLSHPRESKIYKSKSDSKRTHAHTPPHYKVLTTGAEI